MLTPNDVLGALGNFQAKSEQYPADIKRAAVCMVLQHTDQGLALLMMRRAEFDGDPWSGQMAFPGGRVEPEDASPYAGAVRECLEEVGVDLEKTAKFICPLTEVRATLRGRSIDIVVSPYVFIATETLTFTLNREVADTVLIPLSFLLDGSNQESFMLHYDNADNEMPCYHYQQYKVWGLSLRFIEELLRIVNANPP